jgi:hypothetical protein
MYLSVESALMRNIIVAAHLTTAPASTRSRTSAEFPPGLFLILGG